VAVKFYAAHPDQAIVQNRERRLMRAFIVACIAAIAIAVIGAFVLGKIQQSADQAFSTSAVRLGQ
jgi:ABC-type uncharacterized transport system permease subunit